MSVRDCLWLLAAVLAAVPAGRAAYPVYGTKRYGRSAAGLPATWGLQLPAYYYGAHPRHYPLSYYEALAPYAPSYADDYYYPQEAMSYPLYYPAMAHSNAKYDLYQPPLPYYYADPPAAAPGYTYYDGDSDLQDEMLQAEEREQREQALPIGQETWYETDDVPSEEDSFDDVNAAFIQNLMMYNDALNNQRYPYAEQQPVDAYMQPYNDDYLNWNMGNYNYEDEEEKELKMLTDKPKKQKSKSSNKQNAGRERKLKHKQAKGQGQGAVNGYESNDSEAWINWDNKRVNKHAALKTPAPELAASSTAAPPAAAAATSGRDARGGQKEFVMMRPATPVRRPFSEPVLKLLAEQGGPERKRTPSVYDTIKHLLAMEKSLEKEKEQSGTWSQARPQMRKRFVSSEESLVEELSGLKKTA